MQQLKLLLLSFVSLALLACSSTSQDQNISTPTNFKLLSSTASSITVSWEETNNTKSYELSYKANTANNYTILDLSTETTKTITGLRANTNYTIRLRAKNNDGVYSDYNSISAKTKKADNRFTVSISGQVIDSSTGEGVDEVKLQLGEFKESTNSSGSFNFDNIKLNQGSYILTIKHNNYIPASKNIKVNKDESISLNIIRLNNKEKATATALTGIVTDKTSKAVLEGVIVRIGQDSNTTDSNGYYEIKGILPSTYNIIATKKDYQSYSDDVTLETAKTNTHNIELVKIQSISTPTNFKLLSSTASSITVSWDKTNNAKSYELSYKADTANNYTTLLSTETTKTLNNLEANTGYTIRLRANYGNGAYSGYARLQAKTKAKPLTNFNINFIKKIGLGSGKLAKYTEDKTGQIITDQITGLMWQKNDRFSAKTWFSARTYCQNLKLGAYNDWRLPSIKELLSIVDYAKTNPSIHDSFVAYGDYWTNTPYARYLYSSVWYVNFDDGISSTEFNRLSFKSVRCVRSLATTSYKQEFTRKNSQKVVVDALNQIMWQDNPAVTSNYSNYTEAKSYCKALRLAGYNNWRLPSITELLNIVYYGRIKPSIHITFKHTSSTGFYWSSSAYNDSVWNVNFNGGNSLRTIKTNNLAVRCVRFNDPTMLANKKPSAPTNLRANTITSNSISLSWNASNDIDGNIASYQLDYNTANNYTTLILSTETNKTITDLRANTNYTIRLRAKDNDGAYSTYSFINAKTIAKANNKPIAPSNLDILKLTDSTIKLTWNASNDIDGNIANYELSYKKSDTNDNNYSIINLDATETTKTLNNLESNTSYTIRLRAKDNDGAYSTYSSIDAKTKAKIIIRTSKLKQTGQTRSYVDYDDGYYKKGIAPSYTRDDFSQIVTDNVTKLQWQDNRIVANNYRNWYAAINYCSNLSLGAYSDWRLPTKTELSSIIDLGRYKPAINPVFRHRSIYDQRYWSSTSYANNGSWAWTVDFEYGDDGSSQKSYTHYRYVRCVRGTPLTAPSFTRDDSKQIVTDNTNNLQWQDNEEANSTVRNWQAAIQYCEDLDHAGSTDWRLPNQNELKSITDLGRVRPAINPAFKHISDSSYWSSTSYVDDSDDAWNVSFIHGVNWNSYKSGYNHVRCVR